MRLGLLASGAGLILLLVGCGDTDNQKVAALQDRVDGLEARVASLEQSHTDLETRTTEVEQNVQHAQQTADDVDE
jgi:chaperonin cofactor prefoldin